MGLSMRPLRKMRSVSLAPTLPFRSSMFSRTCWKAAVTRETNYSDQDAIVCNRAGAFVVVVKNLDRRCQPRLFTQDVNPHTWAQIPVVCCPCVPHPLGKYAKPRKSLHVCTVLGEQNSKHTFRCTGFDLCFLIQKNSFQRPDNHYKFSCGVFGINLPTVLNSHNW